MKLHSINWDLIIAAIAWAAVAIGVACRAHGAEIEVYFAPGPDCSAAMVKEISGATSRVHCQYYGFTDEAVAGALVDAKKRGCEVEVILDRSNMTQSATQAPALIKAHIPVSVDKSHPIAHNKVAIIDDREVMQGSYNPTNQAKHNAENLLVIKDDPKLAAKFEANWKVHREHSVDFSNRTAGTQ